MTFAEYEELYASGKIKPTGVWVRKNDEYDIERSLIIPFIWNKKFYLARYTERRYSPWSNAPRWGKSVKEFTTKEQANAYFKKCAVGYRKTL